MAACAPATRDIALSLRMGGRGQPLIVSRLDDLTQMARPTGGTHDVISPRYAVDQNRAEMAAPILTEGYGQHWLFRDPHETSSWIDDEEAGTVVSAQQTRQPASGIRLRYSGGESRCHST